jgi:hypothetical protein
MDGLKSQLEQISLLIYYETFIANGFTSWEKLMNVTEAELTQMYVTLGHRRVG